jgi:hypothetical protein
VHDTWREFGLQANEAAIGAGNLALRMSLLINGGAAVALLTFVGPLPANQKRAVADTLVWFSSGIVAAVAGLALGSVRHETVASIRPRDMIRFSEVKETHMPTSSS